MRRTAKIWVGLLVWFASVGLAEARVVERVLAVVNDDIVLLSELEERLAPVMAQLQQIPDPAARRARLAEFRRQALEQLIDELLIQQEAVKLKISVTDQDLQRAIQDVMRKNNLTEQQLEAALAQEGKSLSAYRDQILKPQLLRLKVLNVQVRSRVAVSDEELKALYQKNMKELGVETKVRARHIFVVIPEGATAEREAERRRYAQSLLEKVRGGQAFEEVAKKFSEDSVTREEGGDLGSFSRGTLPANVEEVVFAMKKGEVRGPLRTERGFHVIQVLGREESSARPFKDVQEELRHQLYGQKLEKATGAWLKEVRKRSFIDKKL